MARKNDTLEFCIEQLEARLDGDGREIVKLKVSVAALEAWSKGEGEARRIVDELMVKRINALEDRLSPPKPRAGADVVANLDDSLRYDRVFNPGDIVLKRHTGERWVILGVDTEDRVDGSAGTVWAKPEGHKRWYERGTYLATCFRHI